MEDNEQSTSDKSSDDNKQSENQSHQNGPDDRAQSQATDQTTTEAPNSQPERQADQHFQQLPPQPTTSQQPQPTPQPSFDQSMPMEMGHKTNTNAVTIVLQALTYAFWFWTLLILSIILSSVLTYLLIDTFDAEWLVYLASSLLVLLPIAFITDRFYRKVEPEKKHGFAAVVMVLNAVVACLVGVGSLITAVIALVSLGLSSGDTNATSVTILSSLIVAGLSILFFIRIVQLKQFSYINKHFSKIIGIVVGLTILLAVVGPAVDTARRRTDRLIESNYSRIVREIERYAVENNGLPDSLDKVDFSDEANKAVDTGRISYEARSTAQDSLDQFGRQRSSQQLATFELCVDWEFEKDSDYSSYNNYPSVSHKKGIQCYDEEVYINTNSNQFFN